MKRQGNLFQQVITPEALYQGYLDARRSKRGTHSAFQFERRLGAQIDNLHIALSSGSYQPKPYNRFIVTEPKPRQISAPAFRDRVVQHAVYRAIQPIFDRTFIDHSFACRPGKGTHSAADYVQAALRAAPPGSYTLQLDIRKFYYRLDRGVLRTLIERKIKDERLIGLMLMFARLPSPLGVPIGNLLSQIYALIYLNPLDHFVKRELKVRRYCRYVDDFILIGLTRQKAIEHRAAIVEFLASRLRLELSRSTIAPIRRGVNFVGYRTWASRRFVRRHALKTFRQSVRRGAVDSAVSSLGHARRTASLQHMLRVIRRNPAMVRRLPRRVRRIVR